MIQTWNKTKPETSDAGKGHIIQACLDRELKVTHAENPGDRCCEKDCFSELKMEFAESRKVYNDVSGTAVSHWAT